MIRWLQHFRLSLRMTLGFGFLLAMLAANVGVALLGFADMRKSTERLMEVEWVKAQAVAELDTATRATARRTLELLITEEPGRRQELHARVADNRRQGDAATETLRRLVYLPEGKQLLSEIEALRKQYLQTFERQDAELAAGHRAEAMQLAQAELLPLLDRLQAKTRALSELQTRLAGRARDSVRASADSALWMMLAIGAVALVAGTLLAAALARSITRPVAQAVALARRVAEGDLSVDIATEGRDEVAELQHSLRDMTARLAGVVASVRGNAESVATASAQIAHGNHDLSQRTEEQASALQQTAASMEQLGSTVEQNASHARQANELAASAAQVARSGGDAVGRVVTTMQGIHDSSRRIAEIIGVIDGIAFQTNILALNAAVEAARAGEQGRGFAVVAGEVRALAQRSAEAAREIKSLISASVEQVEQGHGLVADAGQTMQRIMDAIQRVSTIVDEISHASAEQSAGVGQVGQAVSQMDQVTQQNAALVEESAAAAESLKEQAAQLVGAVAVFRLASQRA
ncbi:MAG: methyl-accepting chemotaxis protein [Rubrivivax sp.]